MISLQPKDATALSVSPSVHRPMTDVTQDASLIHVLWRRRRVVLAGMGVALVAAVGYLLLAPATYEAVSRVFIEPAGGKMVGLDTNERAAFLFTQREVITSAPVLADALSNPGFLDFETFAKDHDAITFLRNKLSVDVGKKDDLISVSIQSQYPNEATQIVAAVVKSYSTFQFTQRAVLTNEVLKNLQTEKAGIDKEVYDRTKALRAFALEHRIVGPEAAASQDTESLKTITETLTQAHMDTLKAASRLAAVRPPKGPAGAADDADSSYTIEDEANVRQQLLVAHANLDALTSKYGSSSAMVRAAMVRVDQLRRRRYDILSSIHTAAVKRENDLHAFYEAEQRRHIEQRTFAADYVLMTAELQRLQERADTIDTRLRDLRVNDFGKMANVSVLEPARIDPLTVGPKKGRTLALALVGGLLLGLACALAWDQLDGRLMSAAQAERWLSLPSLGALPVLSAARSSHALPGYPDPHSTFTHACLQVWAAVQAMGGGQPLKSLAVASPSRGDGRSTVARGLAIAMAQHGRRVLLIDADIVSPKLSLLFGIAAGPGFEDVLSAEVDVGAIRRVARATTVPNLSLLAGGRLPSVDSGRFADLLDAAAKEFDTVIVDTPPAHKSDVARLLAAHCQATVLVVRVGHTDGFAAGRVRNEFYNAGAAVLGVVMNQATTVSRPTVTVGEATQPGGPRDLIGLPVQSASISPEPRSAGGLSVAS